MTSVNGGSAVPYRVAATVLTREQWLTMAIVAFRDEMQQHARNPETRGWIADHSIAERLEWILRNAPESAGSATEDST